MLIGLIGHDGLMMAKPADRSSRLMAVDLDVLASHKASGKKSMVV